MKYTVIVSSVALKAIGRLPKRERETAQRKIADLADDPRPPGATKIVGKSHAYRLRIGDWRILYDIEDRVLRVTVFSVAHRGDAYRRL
jgi:mRNA interferase RelE/StbE